MLLKHSLYVITGANRGFGKTIAEAIAKKAKDPKTSIVLVGRNEAQLEEIKLNSDKVTCHYIANANLQGSDEAKQSVVDKLESLLKDWQDKDVAPITNAILINNAGSTGDLSKKVGDYDAAEIQEYVNLNITSYISLVSGFIQLFKNGLTDLTIVNISSLLAVQAFPNWGLYATGKSARDMLLKVVAKEEPSVKTLSYAPGPLNNEMQQNVRETLGDTEQKELYTKMANEGNLVNMNDSAEKLVSILQENKFESGSHVDYYD